MRKFRKKVALAFKFLALMAIAQPLLAQEQASMRDTTLDLSLLVNGSRWAVFNRQVAAYEDEHIKDGVYINARPGQGVAWLPSFQLSNGTIEVEVKGRNVPQQSFVGLAFHGVSLEHYEAIYLRP